MTTKAEMAEAEWVEKQKEFMGAFEGVFEPCNDPACRECTPLRAILVRRNAQSRTNPDFCDTTHSVLQSNIFPEMACYGGTD